MVPKSVPVIPQSDLIAYDKTNGPFFISSKEEERAPLLAKTGLAALPPRTIPEILAENAVREKDHIAYAVEWPEPAVDNTKIPSERIPTSKPLEEWRKWSYAQLYTEVKKAAKGFIALGFMPHETVSILAYNSPFWAISALAAIYAGGMNNGMYATDSEEQLLYKLEVSDSTIVIVDSLSNYKKFANYIDKMPTIKAIVVFKEEKKVIPTGNSLDLTRSDGTVVKVLSFEELFSVGESISEEVISERVAKQKPGMCCTLAFTSGTTGHPKAVMLSHDNVLFQGYVCSKIFPPSLLTTQTRVVSYLPLSHVAAFMVDIATMLCSPIASEHKGYTSVYCSRSYDLKLGTLVHRLQAIRPNLFFAVPRVWEKIMERIKENAPTSSVVRALSSFAKKKQLAYQQNLQLGCSGEMPFGISISNFVVSKVHKKLGLDQCHFACSGAAAMKMETLEYWASLGINIAEGYGMSENCGAATFVTHEYKQFGTVGPAVSSTEVKIFRKEEGEDGKHELIECPRAESLAKGMISEECQGEICYRGRHIMLGYLANKRLGTEHLADMKKKNEDAIDEFGWLHSGDKGFITKEGMVKVSGRYKELIIGAGGENIAPVPIEDFFKQVCPVISNIIMVGDKRKYNVCLITLKVEGATGEVPGTNVLAGAAKEFGEKCEPKVKTVEEAVKSTQFVKFIEEKLTETNNNGDVILNNTFKIQKFSILKSDFSVETSELTATLKLKRNVVEAKYAEILDKMYESKEVYFNCL